MEGEEGEKTGVVLRVSESSPSSLFFVSYFSMQIDLGDEFYNSMKEKKLKGEKIESHLSPPHHHRSGKLNHR